MLDILMGADQMDLRRTTDQTRPLTAYIGYALTYWGYQLLENALGATVR